MENRQVEWAGAERVQSRKEQALSKSRKFVSRITSHFPLNEFPMIPLLSGGHERSQVQLLCDSSLSY
jgi:hypothetical protein